MFLTPEPTPEPPWGLGVKAGVCEKLFERTSAKIAYVVIRRPVEGTVQHIEGVCFKA
jgi:hypothetical protein